MLRLGRPPTFPVEYVCSDPTDRSSPLFFFVLLYTDEGACSPRKNSGNGFHKEKGRPRRLLRGEQSVTQSNSASRGKDLVGWRRLSALLLVLTTWRFYNTRPSLELPRRPRRRTTGVNSNHDVVHFLAAIGGFSSADPVGVEQEHRSSRGPARP